jgi:hypothetical protein
MLPNFSWLDNVVTNLVTPICEPKENEYCICISKRTNLKYAHEQFKKMPQPAFRFAHSSFLVCQHHRRTGAIAIASWQNFIASCQIVVGISAAQIHSGYPCLWLVISRVNPLGAPPIVVSVSPINSHCFVVKF